MEKDVKRNIVKYAGAGLLVGALAFGAGINVYDAKIDHTEELCPLVSVLGAKHQVDKINDIDGLHAKIEANHYVPGGYSLAYEDGKPVAVKNIINEDGTITKKVYGNIPIVDSIVITNESEEVVNSIRIR